MSDYEKRSDEKNIGRRTFLGLLAAGVVAFFAGKDVIPRLVSSGSSPVTTTLSGGPSGGSTTTTEAESPTAGFRINSVKKGPAFDSAAWRLTVGGLVGAPLTLTFADFTALPQTTVVRDFYCVEGWGVTDVEWKGVLVSELMRRAKVDATATHLVFRSGDDVYADSLTLEQAAARGRAARAPGERRPPAARHGPAAAPHLSRPLRLQVRQVGGAGGGHRYRADVLRRLLGASRLLRRCRHPWRVEPQAPRAGAGISRFVVAERLSHWLYALFFLVAFVTGLLMWIPATRAWMAGARHTVSQYHGYVGAAMIVVPLLLFILLDRRRLGRDLREIDRWDGDDRRWFWLAAARLHAARPADAAAGPLQRRAEGRTWCWWPPWRSASP